MRLSQGSRAEGTPWTAMRPLEAVAGEWSHAPAALQTVPGGRNGTWPNIPRELRELIEINARRLQERFHNASGTSLKPPADMT
jgi:hypothetical protein